MNTDIDFKSLWNREQAMVPDVKEIFEKADQLNRKTRNTIWRGNMLLVFVAIFIMWVWWYYQPQLVTTKIGIVLIIIAITLSLITTGRLLPLLSKAHFDTDSNHYLNQLIHIKQKQQFLNTTMVTCYFVLLSLGIFMYMIEYASRGSITFQLAAYGITAAWIAFNWFYLRPKAIKKQQRAINNVIAKLELVNGELKENE